MSNHATAPRIRYYDPDDERPYTALEMVGHNVFERSLHLKHHSFLPWQKKAFIGRVEKTSYVEYEEDPSRPPPARYNEYRLVRSDWGEKGGEEYEPETACYHSSSTDPDVWLPSTGDFDYSGWVQEGTLLGAFYAGPVSRESNLVNWTSNKEAPFIMHNFGIFSTRTAVEYMHNIITADWALRPMTYEEDRDFIHNYIVFADVEVQHSHDVRGAKYIIVTAKQDNDDTHIGAFRKENQSTSWTLVMPDTLDTSLSWKKKRWILHRAKEDTKEHPHVFIQDWVSARMYSVHPKLVGLEDFEFTEVLQGEGGRWLAGEVGWTLPLYLYVDSNNVIQDRVILKSFTPDKVRLNPHQEIIVHEELTMLNNPYIIALRGSSEKSYAKNNVDAVASILDNDAVMALMDPSQESSLKESVYRLYLEYAPFDSLYTVQAKYMKDRRPVPEVFIWLVLRALVTAFRTLESRGYVHWDVKPQNIFLKDRNEEACSYPGFYQPVLGDFGVIGFMGDYQSYNGGTMGWYSPEQRETEKQLDAQGWSDVPNERHHVYAAGLIAWCLMRNAQLRTSSDTTPQLPFPGATGVANPTAYFDPQHHSAFYSMALERVVEKCMCIDWRERHSLDQIFEEVTEGLAKFQSVHEGIESMSNEELPPWMRVDLGEDISKIGSSFSDYLAAIQARITREEMNSTDSALL